MKGESKEDDNLTEFSVITDETEIGPIENLLDLRISTASLDRAQLAQILGENGGHDVSLGHFTTFLAVDFYNHDTKTTDLADGDDPRFDTLFSFKNTVDDFYLSHLEKDTILVDVFLQGIVIPLVGSLADILDYSALYIFFNGNNILYQGCVNSIMVADFSHNQKPLTDWGSF